ncbi:PRTRC genetic system ThiF family protein [Chitinophaga terrae (ex Kim and Jung 2007)]|uniref:PRTRC system ThiF family protein n=1 Tax=Chitinophaga terrae (ex Kim and Jung 2007) TaxID=408074 RepID=UPI0027875C3B|nr:PRTRC system ThiF family protein [Chitinophaga terrae (ex Kim and Jung 2007)]MDQ0107487.1 PRTRC genetic system ThiF family protein [Chitinophaga terrae (ex Kim and Jung 2007)]
MTRIHYTASYIVAPTNPLTVNLIGAGGTGSKVLTELVRINYALQAFNHPGLHVRLFDGDKVTRANLGRQLFYEAEVGMYKAVALINRCNRGHGTNWKAMPEHYGPDILQENSLIASANITLSCVDKVKPRFQIGKVLSNVANHYQHHYNRPYYWVDFGNNTHTGQVILATVGEHKQPPSNVYETVKHLPPITEEFKEELRQQAKSEKDEPSCSQAEALTRQDLYINTEVAIKGMRLLYNMFRKAHIVTVLGADYKEAKSSLLIALAKKRWTLQAVKSATATAVAFAFYLKEGYPFADHSTYSAFPLPAPPTIL